MPNCSWAQTDNPLVVQYHATEWGRLVHTSQQLFAALALEQLQAGLNWAVVLAKRAAFNEVFADFDFNYIAQFDDEKFAQLLEDKRLIRNRQKLAAIIHNAKVVAAHEKEQPQWFAQLILQTTPPKVNHWTTASQVPQTTAAADKLLKVLKSYDLKFLGPKTVYAFMQAAGLVDDHLEGCFAKPN